ncbi:MAG: hypothetical protein QM610_14630 [Chitinophagaceae bacterium]
MKKEFKLRNNVLSHYYFLSFKEKSLTIEYPKRKIVIPYTEIRSFRFGVSWIKGYAFVIGRNYKIEIKYGDHMIITFKLISLYKQRLEIQQKIYSDILDTLLENIFPNRIISYLNDIKTGNTISIENLKLNKYGIFLQNHELTPWSTINLKAYSTYLAIFNKQHGDIYRSFDYINDWDTLIIYNVCKNLIDQTIIAEQ